MAGVQLEHVVREYTMGRTTIRAVDDISFTIPEGKYTIILGASGAGKSTVLNILGGMDSPTSGRVLSASVLRISSSLRALEASSPCRRCSMVCCCAACPAFRVLLIPCTAVCSVSLMPRMAS